MAETPKANLLIQQGATFRHKFTWQTNKAIPIDLTDFTARMQIRASIADEIVLENLTTENNGITLGGLDGTVALVLSSQVTTDLPWLTGVYDIELISPANEVFRMVAGTVTVSPEVTR